LLKIDLALWVTLDLESPAGSCLSFACMHDFHIALQLFSI